MAEFKIGDIICKDEVSVPYTVENIDCVSSPIPKYKLAQGDFCFWNYCVGWKKLITPDDVLRYGVILTDDNLYCELQTEDDFKNYKCVRIRTISYESRIFYHKMVNGEVVEFKELVV